MADHLRGTAALASRFAEPFGAGELAYALGLFHDAGKADCGWQERLITAEAAAAKGEWRRVGGQHQHLGARLLGRLGANGEAVAGPAAMAILGHHSGLNDRSEFLGVRDKPVDDEERTSARFFEAMAEARKVVDGPCLVPPAWRRDPLLFEMGLRLTFSALVDADHLDTAAHFAGFVAPRVAEPVDMAELLKRFEYQRGLMLSSRPSSRIDTVREALYEEVVGNAVAPRGVFRLPAPTGSGKTIASAGFALHHAARHGHARVVVAVPFLTVTEQNAAEYRRLLGDEVVLEHHSQVESDGRWTRLDALNWDSPFVVTTTVQLFDSLFGRKPVRSRKLHRLANSVIVLDEVQSLPVPLLVPILDALRLLTTHFGTTVLLSSATQPAFEKLNVWSASSVESRSLVKEPIRLYERLRRVKYEWRTSPQLTAEQIASEVASEHQVLVVVNTVRQARDMWRLVQARTTTPVLHLSTRMCPAHRHATFDEVKARLSAGDPVIAVSTQLIEAGVDIDFPVVFRALAPAESLQQAAGRANREGNRGSLGRVVVFDATDMPTPRFYRAGVDASRLHFGPDRADPDDLEALARYYAGLYASLNVDRNKRAVAIQRARKDLDYLAVADGPLVDGSRRSELAFRMIDDDTVPVVVTTYADSDKVESLLADLVEATKPGPPRGGKPMRNTFRYLAPYIAALPRRVVDALPEAICAPVIGDLRRWNDHYDPALGIVEDREVETIW